MIARMAFRCSTAHNTGSVKNPTKVTLSREDLATWPNLITLVRLLCIPIFVWLLLSQHNRGGAAWLLGGLGATDWVDGYVARRYNQTSEFGRLFDPTVDRLLFLVGVTVILIDGSIPLLVAILILGREGIIAVAALILGAMGIPPFDVTFAGKTGALLLMFAVPIFLGGQSALSYAPLLRVLAWVFVVPGIAFSWFSLLFQYVPATRREIQGQSQVTSES